MGWPLGRWDLTCLAGGSVSTVLVSDTQVDTVAWCNPVSLLLRHPREETEVSILRPAETPRTVTPKLKFYIF